MKISRLCMLMVLTSSTCVYAEQPLPPVLDNSTYRGGLYDPVTQPSSLPLQITTPSLSTPNLSTPDSLSKLQNEVIQLKSRVDEQGRALLTLKQRQDAMNGNLDQQLLNLGTGINTTAGALNAHIINTGAPQNPTAVGVVTVPVTTTEKAHYQNAYTLFRNGQFDPAIAEFKGIIASYPGGEFADNSQYWIGEALLKKGDKNGALLAFDQVVRAYPRSAKVPDALLKIGMTQLTLKNKAKAKEYLDFVVKNYPGTSAAGIAATKKSQAGI